MIRQLASVYLLIAVLSFAAFAGSPEIGKPAPDFKAVDVAGKTVTLSEYKGKIVVLEWTNPGCPFVQRHYKAGSLQALQQMAADQGAVWLTINSTNTEHRDHQTSEIFGKTYADWKSKHARLVMDADGVVGKAYDAKTTPHLFVIDKNGVLVYNGAVDSDPRGNSEKRIHYVEDALKALAAGKEIGTHSTTPYGCSVKY